MFASTGRMIERLAGFVAILGGVALMLIALITLISVTGRALIPVGLSPLRGQFELVQALTAFAVCAFLPWAHLKRAHASVAILTDHFGRGANQFIDFLSDAILLSLASLITWRHMAGLTDKMTYGETTFLLRIPLWWAYAACLIGLGAWVIIGLWATLNSARQIGAKPPQNLTGKATPK